MTGALPRWAWISALLASFALGALYHLPLRVALRLAGAGAALERAELTGSVTDWTARFADGLEVRFDASPLVLLTGRYGGRVVVTRDATRFAAEAVRSWSGAIRVSDGTLDAGLAPLATALGMPRSMLEGRLSVTGIQATWRAGMLTTLACTGQVLGVRGGSGSDALALGDLAIECEGGPAGPTVTVADRGGPLAFHAELRFAADGRFLLAGTAGARPGAPPMLAQVLPLLGAASGPDEVSFKYAGALPTP